MREVTQCFAKVDGGEGGQPMPEVTQCFAEIDGGEGGQPMPGSVRRPHTWPVPKQWSNVKHYGVQRLCGHKSKFGRQMPRGEVAAGVNC